MTFLSKRLRAWAALALICLLLVFAIPSEAAGTWLGLSPWRWLMVGVLLVGSLAPLAIEQSLRRRPEHASQADELVQSWMRTLGGRTLHLAAGILLGLLAGLWIGYLFYLNASLQAPLVRLTPIGIFMGGMCLGLLATRPFGGLNQPWPASLAGAAGLTMLGGLLQGWLVGAVQAGRAIESVKVPREALLLVWPATFVLGWIWMLAWLNTSPARRRAWLAVLAFAGGVFALHWRDYPKTYSTTDLPLKLILALAAPLLILGGALLASGLSTGLELLTPNNATHSLAWRRIAWGGALLTVLLLGMLYYNAAVRHAAKINTDAEQFTQGAYLKAAKEARLSGFTDPGDFNRTPLYPYFQALFYQPGMDDSLFFQQSQRINILLTLALLGLAFWVTRSSLPDYAAGLFTLMIAFSLFIFKAAYVKAEPLFYLLAFTSFVLMIRMFKRPSLWLAILNGVVLGLTYLSKATALLALGVFSGVYVLQELVRLWPCLRSLLRRRGNASSSTWNSCSTGIIRVCFYRLALWALFVVMFLGTTYPYIRIAKERFGSYFYNVNTTYYIWYDDIGSAMIDNWNLGFSQKAPDLPPELIPSGRNYLRTHSPSEIVKRIQTGIQGQGYNFFNPFGLTNFQGIFLLLLAIAVVVDWRNAWDLARRNGFLILFVGLFFAAHVASCVWYTYLAAGPRFLHGIYLPLLFAAYAGALALAAHQRRQSQPGEVRTDLAHLTRSAELMVFLLVCLNIWFSIHVALPGGTFGS